MVFIVRANDILFINREALAMRISLAAGLLALGTFLVVGGGGMAGDAKLKVGDKVNHLDSVDETGKAWSGKDLLGKKTIVLYFFPADFTGGCTAQACGFRDNIEKLADKGIVVVAVSGDTAETHAKFKKFHKLPFTLLADTEGKLAKTFSVPVGKGGTAKFTIDGAAEVFTRPVTTSRYTVVIGKDQNILAIDPVKDAKGDSERILKLVSK